MAAVNASTSGYLGEIGFEQSRQRPRSHSQASSGTLSNQRTGALQEGQKEPRGWLTRKPSMGMR
jgi:hypothetical protein